MMSMVAKGVRCRIDRLVNRPGVSGDDSTGTLQSVPEGSNPRPFGPVGCDPLGPVGCDLHPLTITLTALVHPEPEAGGYSAEVPALPGCDTQARPWRRSRPISARPPRDGWSPRMAKPGADRCRPLSAGGNMRSGALTAWCRSAKQASPRRTVPPPKTTWAKSTRCLCFVAQSR